MHKPLMLLVIGLFFGTGIGFLIAASNEATLSGHDHTDPAHHAATDGALPERFGEADVSAADTPESVAHHHNHALLDISSEGVVPTVDLRLHPDGDMTMNLEIITEGFRFAPENVNGPHVPGEGHAHIYVDDIKVARAYGAWFQMTDLHPGARIEVTLNANSHEALADGEQSIAAVITVPGS